MSSGIMCVTHWGGRLGARPVWDYMTPCGSTLGGGVGGASGVVSGVCILRGGVPCGGGDLVKISVICLRADFCLSPNVVGGLVGVGFRRAWVRSVYACVASYFEDSLGKVGVSRVESVVSKIFLLLSWGCRTLGSGNVATLA